MLLSMALSLMAQTDHAYNFYGQLFGPTTGIGIGFDSRFKAGGIFGYSGGVAFTNLVWRENQYWGTGTVADFNVIDTETTTKGLCIPLEVNAIFGRRASKFEVGLGVTTYLTTRAVRKDHWELVRDEVNDITEYRYYVEKWNKKFRPNILGTINIGYRLQRKSGFFMKLGITALVGDIKCSPIDGLEILPNLCFGYTIPHF